MADDQIYQLKISLKGLIPPIWRSFQVAGDVTLSRLHKVSQTVMGWENKHPYRFVLDGEVYGNSQPNDFPDTRAATEIHLQDVAQHGGRFIYVYDFVDDWQHVLRVEKVVPAEAGAPYPRCLAGKRACPPEECGGIWNYGNLLESIQNPQDDNYASALEYPGPAFDPEAFSAIEINQNLSKIFNTI